MLRVVLHEPKIPPNTGCIARLCACTQSELHLIHPLGFDISDKQVKRAGLDYWQHVSIYEHQNWEMFSQIASHGNTYGFSTKAHTSLWDIEFQENDTLVFGSETHGLPESVREHLRIARIPMRKNAPVRSLNLATSVGIVLYEALRQTTSKMM